MTPSRLLLRLLLAVFSLGAPAGCSFSQDMGSYDATRYTIVLRPDLRARTFSGEVTMSAVALKPLGEAAFNASVRTLTIDSVRNSGRRVPFRREGSDTFLVTLARPAAARDSFSLTIFYHGISDFSGDYDDGGVYVPDSAHLATSSEPSFARLWWPCKDTPGDKARVRMEVTVPESLVAGSNGLLVDVRRANGLATYRWETRYPIATYLVSLAVAPYAELHDTYVGLDGKPMPVLYLVYPADTARARTDFQTTQAILGFFARTFCEYPFLDEKFGYAEVAGSLTMENQTLCSIETQLITGTREHELTLVHETAHQWWGDLITPATWHHTWLSEGFATYAEALYLEHSKGAEAYWAYIGRLTGARMGAYAGSVIGRSDTAFWDSFAPRVYFKGALVLHMLRGILGDSTFFRAMRNYLNDPSLRYGNARTEDFQKICERTSGGGSLQWFFDEWVYASTADSLDRPVYEYSWSSAPPAGGTEAATEVALTIVQPNARALLYRMPMAVSVWSGGKEELVRITDSLATQHILFTHAGSVDSVTIDRAGWVFKSLRRREGF